MARRSGQGVEGGTEPFAVVHVPVAILVDGVVDCAESCVMAARHHTPVLVATKLHLLLLLPNALAGLLSVSRERFHAQPGAVDAALPWPPRRRTGRGREPPRSSRYPSR